MWFFGVPLIFSLKDFTLNVLFKFSLMQNELLLLLSFGLILFLSHILIVFIKWFNCRLLKEIDFCSCIIYFKSSYFFPKRKFTIQAHMLSNKIILINFHFILYNDQCIKKLFLIHMWLVFGRLLKNVNELFFFYFWHKVKLFTKNHPFIQCHDISWLGNLVKSFASTDVTLFTQMSECFLNVWVWEDRLNRILSGGTSLDW